MAGDDDQLTGTRRREEEGVALDDDVREPPLYRVLLHNDHFTTMEFVIEVLEGVFRKSPAEATQIMLHVHRRGVGICGVYPLEIAEAKVERVHALARRRGFPLKSSCEEAS